MSPMFSRIAIRRHALAATCAATLALSALLPGRAVTARADSSAAADQVSRVIELTNAERARAGLGPLVANPSLASAASSYADLLASSGCFAHTCGPVPDFSARAGNAGYSGWTALAENIAGGQRTPEQVVDAWMNSPGHRANILNGAYTEIGVGVAAGGQYGIYWAQEFGARRGVAPAVMPAPAPVTPDSEPQPDYDPGWDQDSL